MPVCHFILHAYGSWHPDHPRGWHQHGMNRPQAPAPELAAKRRKSQRWSTVNFSPAIQRKLLLMAFDICKRRSWQPQAFTINETHVHIVVGWRTAVEALDVQAIFKRVLGWHLAQLHAEKGRRWFSDGGVPKGVADHAHLKTLLEEYLPQQGGVFWKRGDPEPL